MAVSQNTYKHGHSRGTLAGHSARTASTCAAFLLPHLSPGLAVLDVGCGPGSITRGLAEAVSPGRTVGVDMSASAIDAALAEPVPANLEFMVGSVFDLPFADGTFDAVYCNQVMLHLPAATVAGAMRGIRRVLNPAAYHGGTQWYPHDDLLARTFDVVMARARAGGAAERAASAVHVRAQDAGWARGDIELGFALEVNDSPEKRAALARQWAARAAEDEYKKFAVESGMMNAEEIERLPVIWREWAENPDAWETMMQIEMLAWKK